jgi:integrase/recombinase XerD
MLIQQTDRIFDTQFDTAQIIVAKVKIKFVLRPISGTTNRKAPIYLHITANYQRERLHLHLYTDPKHWNPKLERSVGTDQLSLDLNLVLDNIMAKITNIKTIYRLSDKVLSPTILKSELLNATPRIDFVSYFKQKLKDHQTLLSAGSYRRYDSVLKKLSEYAPQILFSDLDEKFLLDYRKHLKVTLQNKDTTINSNIIAIKKYLRAASDDGIKLAVDINRVVGGNTHGTELWPQACNETDVVDLVLLKEISIYRTFFLNGKRNLCRKVRLIGFLQEVGHFCH